MNSSTATSLLQIVEDGEVMRLGEEADDIGGDGGADAFDGIELLEAGLSGSWASSSPGASGRSEP